jgi:uncharacterized membrane protein SpoIIM required for sporulation
MTTRQRFVSLLVSKTSTNKSYATIFTDNVRIIFLFTLLGFVIVIIIIIFVVVIAW